MKAIRILEYEGPKEWIEKTLAHELAVHGELKCGEGKYIREISVTYKEEDDGTASKL